MNDPFIEFQIKLAIQTKEYGKEKMISLLSHNGDEKKVTNILDSLIDKYGEEVT